MRINYHSLLVLIVDCIDFESLVPYFKCTNALFIWVSVKTFELFEGQALLFKHIITSHSEGLSFGKNILVEMNFLCQGV